MKNKIDIVVIGTIIKETIIFPDKQMGPVLGSPAAYSSLVMAAQGVKVGIVTYYGNDMEEVISEMDALDKRGILPYSHTTTNLLIYNEDGTKRVEYQKSTPTIKFEDIHKDYLEAKYYKICPMNYEVDLDLVSKLHSMDKVVFIDLGGFGGATSDIRHSIETEYGKKVIETLCNNSSIIKASEEDLASIIPGKTAEEAAEILISTGAPKVVVTLGGKGALYKIADNDPQYIKPFVATSENPDGSLDFTGAGDSFGAGFMASYMQEQDIRKAILNGNATASLVIQRSGGCTYDRMPSKERVQERLQQNNE
jgi:sugar/nucleoside kinase (ribokinase family)